MNLNLSFLLPILAGLVATFIVASKRKYSDKRILAFLAIASFLIIIGHITKTFSGEDVGESLTAAIPVLLMIIFLELFSVVIRDAEIPQRILKWIVEWKKFSLVLMQLVFVGLAYLLSLYVNNLATILVITPVVLKISKELEFDERPLLVSMIIASNIGGASTMIGDFPNVIISKQVKELTYADFLWNLGLPLFLLHLPILFVIFYFMFLRKTQKTLPKAHLLYKVEEIRTHYRWFYRIHKFRTFRQIGILGMFALMSILLAYNLPIKPEYIILTSAAFLLILIEKDKIFSGINLDTLILFLSLFIISGALKSSGIFEYLTGYFKKANFSPFLTGSFLLFVSTFFTAFLSAGPSTAILGDLAKNLSRTMPNHMIWWTLSLGILAGSSATPIGATAGPVMMALYEGHTKKKFPFITFLKMSIPATFLFLLVSHIYIFFRVR